MLPPTAANPRAFNRFMKSDCPVCFCSSRLNSRTCCQQVEFKQDTNRANLHEFVGVREISVTPV